MLVNCEPLTRQAIACIRRKGWSEWISKRPFGFRRQTAASRACRTTLVVCRPCIAPLPDRHLQGKCREEADNAVREEIEHDSEIGKALMGADIGNVGHPRFVRGLHIELAIQRIVDE